MRLLRPDKAGSDTGSALVEAIGMLALSALLVMGLINVSLLVYQQSFLTHVAHLAARAGAIDLGLASGRTHQMLKGRELTEETYHVIDQGGLCLVEVRLGSHVNTVFGQREAVGIAHALCE